MTLNNVIPPWFHQRPQQAYLSVHETEGEKQPLTDTEWTSTQLQKTRPWYRRPRTFVCIIMCMFIAENLFLLTKYLVPKGNEAFPVFPTENRMTIKNLTFEQGVSKESNKLWEDVVPGHTGWVQFNKPAQFGLAPGFPSNDSSKPDDNVYIVTWAHQHHCLKVIRRAFWELVYKGSESPLYGADKFGNQKPTSGKLAFQATVPHLMHCFDYLRQTVACQADMTVEPLDPTLADIDIDGYHVTHQCKSQTHVAKWLVDHAPPRKFKPYFEDQSPFTENNMLYSPGLRP